MEQKQELKLLDRIETSKKIAIYKPPFRNENMIAIQKGSPDHKVWNPVQRNTLKHPESPEYNYRAPQNDFVKENRIEKKDFQSDFLKEFTMPIRQSYGIILVREYKGSYQALMTCRRNTYAFDAFVLGKYSMRKDKSRVKKMFDEMTPDELTDILTLDFKKLWWRFCLKEESNNPFYIKKQTKFSLSFLSDGGKILKNMLLEAEPKGKSVWEFSKGRKSNINETNLETAIREFQEETNIGLNHYCFLDDKTRYSTFVSDGVKYKNMYYIAFLKNENVNISLSLKHLQQLSEVKEIQWMDINDIRKIDCQEKRLELLVQPVFNLVKNKIKGKTRYIHPLC